MNARHTRRALICGISGQDAAYLARLLLEKGYEVFGTSRDAEATRFGNLHALGVRDKVQTLSMAPGDFRSVMQTLMDVAPDEIYNLAGQSSVGLSFKQPVETFESIGVGVINLLEAIRLLKRPVGFYNACSSECFGNTPTQGADESTPFHPRSPYAVAKAAAFWEVANYREGYGLFAVSGILFNHESPLRPERFVTQKIISAARRIAAGSKEKLALGNLSIRRDWGWAPEYVDAMWRMLQQDAAKDFVIATGVDHALEDFVSMAFTQLGLDWREHVVFDPALMRPTDIAISRGNPARAETELGWRARFTLPDVVADMLAATATKD